MCGKAELDILRLKASALDAIREELLRQANDDGFGQVTIGCGNVRSGPIRLGFVISQWGNGEGQVIAATLTGAIEKASAESESIAASPAAG